MMFIRDGRTPPIGPPGVANRNVQLPGDMELLPFYTERAPQRLPAPEVRPEPGATRCLFTRRTLADTGHAGYAGGLAVRLVDFDGDGQLDVLGTDMRQGLAFTATPAAPNGALNEVASIPHPAHVTLADLDKDGVQDLLVAEMGEFFPADHNKGAVIWMRALAKGKTVRSGSTGGRASPASIPRTSTVTAGSISVAAFGWRKTGQVAILENRTLTPSQPSFVTHTIDPRAGSIQLVPADPNRDGRWISSRSSPRNTRPSSPT